MYDASLPNRRVVYCLGLLLLLGAAAPAVELGPLVSQRPALDGNDRLRAVGPFFESQTATNGMSFRAVRPFYSRVSVLDSPRSVTDIVWPLGQIRDLDEKRTWRFLLAFGHDFDIADDDSRSRWRVFPLLFGGRSAQDESYFAFFPIGGKMLESMTCDRLHFVLFPVYAHSQVNDLETTHVLWPLISWARSESTSRFRIFPLYGHSHREGQGTKRFVLWPFWTSARYDDPREQGSGYVLFPLYGRVKTDRQSGWMVLPPFIRYSKGERLTQVHAPWPFVQYSSGDTERLYLFPFWGRKQIGHVESGFVAWPFIHHERALRDERDRRRFYVFPFYYSESTRDRVATNVVAGAAPADVSQDPVVRSRYVKVWPLVSYRREGAEMQCRVLALWPLKQSASVERNLAPLWTLYGRTRAGDAWEEEVLWGLWRRSGDAGGARRQALFPLYDVGGDPVADRTRGSLLGGLIGWEREGMDRRWRFLYLFQTGRRGQADSASEPDAVVSGD